MTSKSNCSSGIMNRFFKVITPDFHATLRLPPVISRKLNNEKVENAVLISRKGSWNVKIGANKEENLCFEDGWNQFVELHGLEVGDFVVFEHLGSMHFLVSIYDHSTACEAKFSLDVPEDDDSESDFRQKIYDVAPSIRRGRPEKIRSGCTEEGRQFVTKVTDRHLSKHGPTLPKYFWKKNKLEQRKEVLLIGPSGEKCQVMLKGHIRGVVYMGNGWMEFCKSNKMKKEDVCLFKLKHNPPPTIKHGGGGGGAAAAAAVEIEVQIISPPKDSSDDWVQYF